MLTEYKILAFAKPWVATIPILGFLATDWLTGNAGLGVLISAAFSVITAVIVTRPKLIAAKAAAMVNTTSAADMHFSSLLAQQNEIHKREIDFWKEKSRRHEKIEVLIRATKHKAFNAYQAATFYIRDAEDLLKANDISFTPFKFQALREITGEEDKKMIEMIFGDDENTP